MQRKQKWVQADSIVIMFLAVSVLSLLVHVQISVTSTI